MPKDADRRLLNLTRRQNGVFTREQALADGVPGSTLDDRVRAGTYEVLHPRVYKLAAAPDSALTRVTAAVLALGPAAVLSHRSAAHLWELRGCPLPDEVDVLVPRQRRSSRSLRYVRIRTTACLPDAHSGSVNHRGVPVTGVARTLWDLAGCVPYEELRSAVVDAIRRRVTRLSELREVGAILGRARGSGAMRRVVEELDPQEERIRSDVEALFPRLMRGAGLPEPVMNHPVRDVNGDLRILDAAFLPEKVPVELDTPAYHGLPTDRNDDLRRENAVVLTDWRSFLRFTAWQLRNEPEVVVATVRAALKAARDAGGPA
ncbi:MAG: type IV toxin-antitoxin system AbiEi family antitoxin domain-containing protein [Nitriliruptorales bacterium]